MDTEVLIVGAGPAGTAAAITAAKAGRRVTVIDKAIFPRDKCCGDGLTTGALRLLEGLGLAPETIPSWLEVTEARVVSPSGRIAEFGLQHDGAGGGIFAATATRFDLDAALVDLAVASGADVLDGHGLTSISIPNHQRHIEAQVDGLGTFRARYLIAADGMWSPTRKLLGLENLEDGTYLGDWHGIRQYFSKVGPLGASQLWVWFEADLLPGYMWSFPLPNGRANVGFGLLRGSKKANFGGALGKHMSRLWPELLARPHIRDVLGPDAQPEDAFKAWPIPARLGSTELSGAGGRVLFVGDAARATDPLTGEGIGQALETGIGAIEAILAAGALHPEQAAARYETELSLGMALDHQLARLLAKAMSHRKGARAAVRIAGSTPWIRRNFSRWLFEDYPRAVLATPHRWHRKIMTGGGAYRA